jgi:hypothetical protein
MAPGSASLVLHHSMVRLPDQPMRPRLADPRVGFLTRERIDFSLETNRAPVRRLAERWRLEKKDPSAETSDPVKPIEIHVDPATPSKWVPYVKQGIEDWRRALEEAGSETQSSRARCPQTTRTGVLKMRATRWFRGNP